MLHYKRNSSRLLIPEHVEELDDGINLATNLNRSPMVYLPRNSELSAPLVSVCVHALIMKELEVDRKSVV